MTSPDRAHGASFRRETGAALARLFGLYGSPLPDLPRVGLLPAQLSRGPQTCRAPGRIVSETVRGVAMGVWVVIVVIVGVAVFGVWLGRPRAFGRGYSNDHQD